MNCYLDIKSVPNNQLLLLLLLLLMSPLLLMLSLLLLLLLLPRLKLLVSVQRRAGRQSGFDSRVWPNQAKNNNNNNIGSSKHNNNNNNNNNIDSNEHNNNNYTWVRHWMGVELLTNSPLRSPRFSHYS